MRDRTDLLANAGARAEPPILRSTPARRCERPRVIDDTKGDPTPNWLGHGTWRQRRRAADERDLDDAHDQDQNPDSGFERSAIELRLKVARLPVNLCNQIRACAAGPLEARIGSGNVGQDVVLSLQPVLDAFPAQRAVPVIIISSQSISFLTWCRRQSIAGVGRSASQRPQTRPLVPVSGGIRLSCWQWAQRNTVTARRRQAASWCNPLGPRSAHRQ
jgi:hypothetical protein